VLEAIKETQLWVLIRRGGGGWLWSLGLKMEGGAFWKRMLLSNVKSQGYTMCRTMM